MGTIQVDDEGGKPEADAAKDEGDDSFRKKKDAAVKELTVILSYLKDFKTITEALKKDQRAQDTRGQRKVDVAAIESSKMPEAVVVEAEPPRGDRGSQNSGSAGNTRERAQMGDQ